MRTTAEAVPTALLVAAFDSQLKWASYLRTELLLRGFRCRVVAPRERATLSAEQIAATGVDGVELVPRDALVDLALEHDVVVCALAGPQVRQLTLELDERLRGDRGTPGPRPVVVAGWVGIIIEKITAGYLDRSGADVVVVNSARELEHFRAVADRLELPDDNLVLSGLPILGGAPRPQRTGSVRTILFADQPTVPDSPVDRLHVYRRLIELARRHPDREVLLKPRHRRGEGTFHRMHHHPGDLLAREHLPPNFRVVHEPIATLLDDVDLLLTMSSTACLEAVDRGCRVALVLDLGVHERYGNHVFLDSGLLRTFDQIAGDDLGTPDPAWVDSWFGGRGGQTPAQIVIDRIEKLLASGERPSQSVMASAYQRGAADLHRARRRGDAPAPPSAWRRRRANHGLVRGTAMHLGFELVPPGLQRPVRRWWRDHR